MVADRRSRSTTRKMRTSPRRGLGLLLVALCFVSFFFSFFVACSAQAQPIEAKAETEKAQGETETETGTETGTGTGPENGDGGGGGGGDGGGDGGSQTTAEKAAAALAAALTRDREGNQGEANQNQNQNQNQKVVESGGVRVVVTRTSHQRASGSEAVSDIVSAFGAVTDEDDFERDNHFIVGVGAPLVTREAVGKNREETGSDEESEAEGEKAKVQRRRSVVLTTSEGVQMKCTIPVVETPQAGEKNSREGQNLFLAQLLKDDDDKNENENEQKGREVLAVDEKVKQFAQHFLGDATVNTCHKKLSGWWTYELCPLAHIKQYHDEHGKVQSSFSLGIINTEKTWNLTKASFSSDSRKKQVRSISFAYDHGTKCDLNGLPRETIVNFHCSPNLKDAIKQVTETSTCSYLVDFESKELCKHEEFQQKESDINHIECSPLLA